MVIASARSRNSARGARLWCTALKPVKRKTGSKDIRWNVEELRSTIPVRAANSQIIRPSNTKYTVSGRRSENAWYSHTSRAFHAHLVADTYNAHLAEIEAEIAETYRDTPLTHVVPALMFTGIKYGVQFELITPSRPSSLSAGKRAGLEWWNRGSKVAFKQRWLKPRVSDLIEVYRDSEDGGKQTRVVEGVFHLGEEYAVFLSVRLRKSESGRWEPGYCIARYGTQAGEPA